MTYCFNVVNNERHLLMFGFNVGGVRREFTAMGGWQQLMAAELKLVLCVFH